MAPPAVGRGRGARTGASLQASKTIAVCVFAGPTLAGDPIPAGIMRFGPAALGSVFRAVHAGFRRVGIVDGLFGNVPSVGHKEILYAISRGVEVAGAGSMGALRAAELRGHGMVGIGRIYRMFSAGAWTDDDEVAVMHATSELGFMPASEAMANVRFTLRALRRRRLVDAASERELVHRLKQRHFSERTRDAVRAAMIGLLGERAGATLSNAYDREHVDAKRRDARALVAYLLQPPHVAPPSRRPFVRSRHWRIQFERELADLPPLQ